MPEHTIAENLVRLQNARSSIISAISAKGGTVSSSDGYEDFPAAIASIPSGGGGSGAAGVTAFDFRNMRLPDYTTGTVIASAGASGGAAGATTIIEED